MKAAQRKIWGRLNDEADRFSDLAALAALKALNQTKPEERAQTEKVAKDHQLRSETFREAARLAQQP